MFDFNEAIEIALRTWYPENHLLHMNSHHPLGKLLGEWGELLDDYMKFIYKPGYILKPKDELGDIWYYVRILCCQTNIMPRMIENIIIPELDVLINISKEKDDILIKATMYELSQYLLIKELASGSVSSSQLVLSVQYSVLIEIARRYDLTLDDLTVSNWQKLKPGSERGEQWRQV